MELRPLGRTDMKVSAIGFGAWAIGGSWGDVDDEASMRELHAGTDAGMNFIDTADDHRSFNREGQAFDKGETLSGVPYEAGLAAVDELRPLVPRDASLTQLALLDPDLRRRDLRDSRRPHSYAGARERGGRSAIGARCLDDGGGAACLR
jgi:hypothetical protein